MSSSVDPESEQHGNEPWMQFAGMVESGDPDSSLRIDEVVYGGTL